MTRLAKPEDSGRALALVEHLVGRFESEALLIAKQTFDTLCDRVRGEIRLAFRADDTGETELLGVCTQSFPVALRFSTGGCPKGEYAVLEEMIVSETGRGLGIGRILLQAAIDSAQRRGCAEMGLYVVNGLGSRPFYERMGFEFEGTAGGKWCSKILQSDYSRMDAGVNNDKQLARVKAKEAASKARL